MMSVGAIIIDQNIRRETKKIIKKMNSYFCNDEEIVLNFNNITEKNNNFYKNIIKAFLEIKKISFINHNEYDFKWKNLTKIYFNIILETRKMFPEEKIVVILVDTKNKYISARMHELNKRTDKMPNITIGNNIFEESIFSQLSLLLTEINNYSQTSEFDEHMGKEGKPLVAEYFLFFEKEKDKVIFI